MDRHIANFCDDKMLSNPAEFTDEAGNLLLDKLGKEYETVFLWLWPDQWERYDMFGIWTDASLQKWIRIEVANWWSKYPLAFKYNNYEYA